MGCPAHGRVFCVMTRLSGRSAHRCLMQEVFVACGLGAWWAIDLKCFCMQLRLCSPPPLAASWRCLCLRTAKLPSSIGMQASPTLRQGLQSAVAPEAAAPAADSQAVRRWMGCCSPATERCCSSDWQGREFPVGQCKWTGGDACRSGGMTCVLACTHVIRLHVTAGGGQ